MSRPGSAALGEVPFALDELFYSTTDRRGIIRTGNHVFERISGYPIDELYDRPHNVVRHPDMPRAAFSVFWDLLHADRPAVAYVQNRAKDGRAYWVLATAVPIPDGYLSIRIKPSGPLFPTVKALYEQLREVEIGIERAGGSRPDAIAVSRPMLESALLQLGFASYDRFMAEALISELRSRDEALGRLGRRAITTGTGAAVHLLHLLEPLFRGLDRFRSLHGVLIETSETVLDQAEDIRYTAMNALVASGTGRQDRTLTAVSDELRVACGDTATLADGLTGVLDTAATAADEVAMLTALATLETELISVVEGSTSTGRVAVGPLVWALGAEMHQLGRTVDELRDRLDDVRKRLDQLDRQLDGLQALERIGRVEAARTAAARFLGLFDEIRALTTSLDRHARALRTAVGSGQEVLVDPAPLIDALEHLAAELGASLAA